VRRGQSQARADTPLVEWDAQRGLLKVNPLADIDLPAIRAYARDHDVPLNPLHERGFPSIGCEPCTRAIKPGEPERAGRWWWEQDQKRECGLHVKTAEPTPQEEPVS
jgi:phosphoadenosine phosphosulfate reductase